MLFFKNFSQIDNQVLIEGPETVSDDQLAPVPVRDPVQGPQRAHPDLRHGHVDGGPIKKQSAGRLKKSTLKSA